MSMHFTTSFRRSPMNPTSMSSFENTLQYWINRSWTWDIWYGSRQDPRGLNWSAMVAGTEDVSVIWLLFFLMSYSSSHVCTWPRLLFGDITTGPEERLHIWTEITSDLPFNDTKLRANSTLSGKLDRGHGWTHWPFLLGQWLNDSNRF